MGLKYGIKELFHGKFPQPQNLYNQLQDLDRQIEDGADAVPIVKDDVNLTKTALKKAFGDPKKFDKIGIINNQEGSYLIVATNKEFKIIPLENI